jgi:hypothetical protein
MQADTSEVCQRNDWVWRVRARREEEWAPPVRLRRWGRRRVPDTHTHSTSRLARWVLSERMLTWLPPRGSGAAASVRSARLMLGAS